MNLEDKLLVISGVTLIVVLIGSIVVNFRQQDEIARLTRERWRINWSPEIQQVKIENTTYYLVNIGHDTTFVSRDVDEVISWAFNYTEEWGWVWQNH